MAEYHKIAKECILPSAKILKINGMVVVENIKETQYIEV
jgi:uncharacterized protein YdbL (DUF1318 family)